MNYILNNKILTNFLDKAIVDDNGDFKQHFYLIMLESLQDQKKLDNLTRMYLSKDSNELGRYCTGIISRQYSKGKSSFNYKPRINGKAIEVVSGYDFKSLSIADTAYKEPDVKQTVDRIIEELNHLIHYDAILFKLYYGIDCLTNEIVEPKTYQEIQTLIGINYQTVRNSVIRTKKMLLEKIKL